MSPVLLAMLIIVVASAVVAYLTLTLLKPDQREVSEGDGEQLSDAELRRQQEQQRQAREAAQDRLFNSIRAEREARAQRKAQNATRYDADQLPHTLTEASLLALFYLADDDAYYALAYLLPGHIPLPADDPDAMSEAFSSYWNDPSAAYWTWYGDNTLEDYSEDGLRWTVNDRLTTMRGALEMAGWRVLKRHQPAEEITLLHLSK